MVEELLVNAGLKHVLTTEAIDFVANLCMYFIWKNGSKDSLLLLTTSAMVIYLELRQRYSELWSLIKSFN